MKTFTRTFLMLTSLFFINFSCFTQDSWMDIMHSKTYSPRYFGPNAFPIPVLRNASTYDRYEIEIRWESHRFTGDHTKDYFFRAAVPIVKGRAAVEVTYLLREKYKLTPETGEERQTGGQLTGKNNGDVVLSAIFQVLRKPELVDILVSGTLKTASGDELKRARFTDAASYWFDVNVARDIYRNPANNLSVRLQAMGGFYCWMTYGYPHRQNDGPSFGVGLTATYHNFTFSTDFAGFSGYEHNGDNPRIIRNNLRYEYKKNILSVNYNHGMLDNLYNTWSIGYIRCF